MRKRSRNFLALLIALIITLYFWSIFQANPSYSNSGESTSTTYELPEDDTAFGGIFSSPHVNDSLPHFQYKKIEDSIKMARADAELDNRSVMASGWTIGPVGVYSINQSISRINEYAKHKMIIDSLDKLSRDAAGLYGADSIMAEKKMEEVRQSMLDSLNNITNKKIKQYYLGLNGYSIPDFHTRFFIQHNTYNLAHLKIDSVQKRENSTDEWAHYERKQISVRYAAEDKRILIPVSKNQHTAIEALFYVAIFLQIFFVVYIFIGLPVQILISISKGNAFDPRNISRLKLMSFVLFILTFVGSILPFLLHFVFRHKIPAEIVLDKSIFETIINSLYYYAIAVGLFIVAKAFEKGYRLQEEQNLTV